MFVTAIELGAVETRHDDEEPTSVCGKRLAALRFLAVCGSIE
jgi:hypothetical protein